MTVDGYQRLALDGLLKDIIYFQSLSWEFECLSDISWEFECLLPDIEAFSSLG